MAHRLQQPLAGISVDGYVQDDYDVDKVAKDLEQVDPAGEISEWESVDSEDPGMFENLDTKIDLLRKLLLKVKTRTTKLEWKLDQLVRLRSKVRRGKVGTEAAAAEPSSGSSTRKRRVPPSPTMTTPSTTPQVSPVTGITENLGNIELPKTQPASPEDPTQVPGNLDREQPDSQVSRWLSGSRSQPSLPVAQDTTSAPGIAVSSGMRRSRSTSKIEMPRVSPQEVFKREMKSEVSSAGADSSGTQGMALPVQPSTMGTTSVTGKAAPPVPAGIEAPPVPPPPSAEPPAGTSYTIPGPPAQGTLAAGRDTRVIEGMAMPHSGIPTIPARPDDRVPQVPEPGSSSGGVQPAGIQGLPPQVVREMTLVESICGMRLDESYQVSTHENRNFICRGYHVNEAEYRQVLRAHIPSGTIMRYNEFRTLARERHPGTWSVVIFKGLPFGISEEEYMKPFLTWNGMLDEGIPGARPPTGIAVKAQYPANSRGSVFFNGMVYVAYHNRMLAELAVEYWDHTGIIGVGGLEITAEISSYPIHRGEDGNVAGGARYDEDVWSFKPQLSNSRRKCRYLGFPLHVTKYPLSR